VAPESFPTEESTSPAAIIISVVTSEAEQLVDSTTIAESSRTPEALPVEESDVPTDGIASTTISETPSTEQATSPATVDVSTVTSEASSESTAVTPPQIDVNNRNGYRAVGYFGNWVTSSHFLKRLTIPDHYAIGRVCT
jgi:hypothetical protein